MTQNFRLLQASTSLDHKRLFYNGKLPDQSSKDVQFSRKISGGSGQNWVSVIIGKNGVGKSRLLADVCDIFEAASRGSGRLRSGDLSASRIKYCLGGDICEIDVSSEYYVRGYINGQNCSFQNLPLPKKIIALTTTPFDKFRVPRSIYIKDMFGPEKPERYTYLGLRDRSGRASPTAAIFRALEGLFEVSEYDAKRRGRITEVFKFLGYRPTVQAVYEVTATNAERLGKIASGLRADLFNDNQPAFPMRSLERMLEQDAYILDKMAPIAREVLNYIETERYVRARADFEAGSIDDTFFRNLQLLRRADLIRMRSVEIEREDGQVLDLKRASSGELGIVTSFLGLSAAIEDGSLIFIDEPEISLHPEWQNRYIDLLLSTFRSFNGCHFVLATHSPLILSDISPENSDIVFLDSYKGLNESAENYSGKSSDYLLINAFQVPGRDNLYLKQEIIKALRLAADGKTESAEFKEIIEMLSGVLPGLEKESATAKLISDLRSAAA